jgi:hypothetical protein
MRYPAALAIVQQRVRPEKEKIKRKAYRENWWRFSEPIAGMRAALKPLSRYIAANAQGKRVLFCWVEPWVCPSNATTVFAFENDYSIGVLLSSIHAGWAKAQGSTLRVDIRYTPTTVFETFPWPQPADREPIATAARAVIAVGDGAHRDLRDLHVALDEAVAAAYGWAASAAHDAAESNRLLLELNRAISGGEVAYHPFD